MTDSLNIDDLNSASENDLKVAYEKISERLSNIRNQDLRRQEREFKNSLISEYPKWTKFLNAEEEFSKSQQKIFLQFVFNCGNYDEELQKVFKYRKEFWAEINVDLIVISKLFDENQLSNDWIKDVLGKKLVTVRVQDIVCVSQALKDELIELYGQNVQLTKLLTTSPFYCCRFKEVERAMHAISKVIREAIAEEIEDYYKFKHQEKVDIPQDAKDVLENLAKAKYQSPNFDWKTLVNCPLWKDIYTTKYIDAFLTQKMKRIRNKRTTVYYDATDDDGNPIKKRKVDKS